MNDSGSGSALNKLALKLSVSQMIFNAILQFSNLFINLFLFKIYGEVQVVAQYNILVYLSWLGFYYIGLRRFADDHRRGMASAGVVCALAVASLIAGNENPYALGFLMGAVGGFFWAAYLPMYASMGRRSEAGGSFARQSVLTGIVNMAIPMVWGYLIVSYGYSGGFVALLLLAASLLGMSRAFRRSSSRRMVVGRSSFRHFGFLGVNVLSGFYQSFTPISVGLLVYMTGQNEGSVGMLATLYSLTGLCVNLLIAFVIPDKYGKLALLIGVSLFFAASGLYLFDWDFRAVLFNFMISMASPLFGSPLIGFNMAYINRVYSNAAEGLLVRESGITAGRVAFFVYMGAIGLNIESPLFYLFLVPVSCLPIVIAILIHRMNPNRKEARRLSRPIPDVGASASGD